MSKYLSSLAGIVAAFSMAFAPLATRAEVTTAFSPGDLIKGTQFSTVYYFGPDGRRYVFPNDKTYFTWYSDFSKVKTVPDGVLGAIPLGKSNVTYRPGFKMVKITTDPKTYVVDQGGVLRHVPNEEIAKTLYGISWNNKIDDIPDPFFINYKVGTPLSSASDFKPADVMTGTPTIAIDKQFDEKAVTVTISSQSNGFVPATTTIKTGSTVTWTNNDIVAHSVVGTGFESAVLQPGQTYTKTFSFAGSFDYHCGVHPVMNGTINVVN